MANSIEENEIYCKFSVENLICDVILNAEGRVKLILKTLHMILRPKLLLYGKVS